MTNDNVIVISYFSFMIIKPWGNSGYRHRNKVPTWEVQHFRRGACWLSCMNRIYILFTRADIKQTVPRILENITFPDNGRWGPSQGNFIGTCSIFISLFFGGNLNYFSYMYVHIFIPYFQLQYLMFVNLFSSWIWLKNWVCDVKHHSILRI